METGNTGGIASAQALPRHNNWQDGGVLLERVYRQMRELAERGKLKVTRTFNRDLPRFPLLSLHSHRHLSVSCSTPSAARAGGGFAPGSAGGPENKCQRFRDHRHDRGAWRFKSHALPGDADELFRFCKKAAHEICLKGIGRWKTQELL